ncbi:MAG: pyruvate dehydrogenase complex E1 component subunit beta [Myxococcota bacterium]|nr:pyruvate dehydrogenase complex E1 component subunit beta [Myxococcota bacterium]MEC8380020.1 pyruvate dehydrogenase complex E1 component subunit beta [Myxococcota bacterium]
MATLQIREALRRAMTEEMERDDNIFLMGEEVANYNGAYKVSQGMLDKFGPDRIVDTPISEAGFAGLGIGAAMVGMRPIIEFMTWNFSLVAYDQLINTAAKTYQMSAGQYTMPITFRAPNGAAENLAAQHSTSVDSLYAHFPGLKVVTYATPDDAYGLLKSSIRDNNPVIFMESELTYGMKGEVPDEEYTTPIGKARLRREGSDITIITWGKQVFNVMKAVDALTQQGVDVEVLDLRSLRPLDEHAIYNSVAKTGKCVVVHEGHLFAGVGAEIAARLQQACFEYLSAPVLRITNRDVPQPYATILETEVMPDPARIIAAVQQTLEY